MKPYRIAVLGAVLIAGCATTPTTDSLDDPSRSGAVGMRDITQYVAPGARMVLAENESFLVPLDDDGNATPVYPADLLVRQLPPRTVCLQVGIADDGRVLSSMPVAQPPDCPAADAVEPEFLAAAAQAVQGWRYDPALRCIFPDVKTKDSAVGSCNGGREVPQAVSLTYRFTFEQRDGRGSVRMSQ